MKTFRRWSMRWLLAGSLVATLAVGVAAIGRWTGDDAPSSTAEALAGETSVSIDMDVMPVVRAYIEGLGLGAEAGFGGDGFVFSIRLNLPRALTTPEVNTLGTRIKTATGMEPMIAQVAR